MIYDTMLVTGCGGDIGLALACVAREAGAVRRLIGCDIHADHAGSVFFDVCELAPRASDAEYLDALQRLVVAHKVDVIVPISEVEIARLLSVGSLENFAGVPMVAANRLAVEIGLDKYATFERLSASGIGVPWTRIVGKEPPVSLPCIVKPRRGQGSKGMQLVETEAEAEFISGIRGGDLWQERLLPDDEEYTCGLYRGSTGVSRAIILRRRLQGGLTSAAEWLTSRL